LNLAVDKFLLDVSHVGAAFNLQILRQLDINDFLAGRDQVTDVRSTP
jgi:hypothetical protein